MEGILPQLCPGGSRVFLHNAYEFLANPLERIRFALDLLDLLGINGNLKNLV